MNVTARPLCLALLILAACSEELPIVEVGDLRGAPLTSAAAPADDRSSDPVVVRSGSPAAPAPPVAPTAVVKDAVAGDTLAEDVAAEDTVAKEAPAAAAAGASTAAVTTTQHVKPAGRPEPASLPADFDEEEIHIVAFDALAGFDYVVPTLDQVKQGTAPKDQIPASVAMFDGKRVELEGYMIPMDVEKGRVKSFILSRTLAGCCFGDMPDITEWVDVVMAAGKGADYVPYAPVLVVGRLAVGEAVDEYGVLSVYRMTAESVEDPW